MTQMIGIETRHARGRRRSLRMWVAALATVGAALVFASPSLGWSQVYRGAGLVNPGGIAYSANNANLHYNEAVFNQNGYNDLMQLTLCNTVPECYPYSSWYTSFADTRSISYGHAKCTAYQYNVTALYVHHCFTHNQ